MTNADNSIAADPPCNKVNVYQKAIFNDRIPLQNAPEIKSKAFK